MRARGVAGSVGGLGVSDHVCWTFGSDEEYREFRDAALYFAADGMALRQRLFYVSERRDDDVLTDLRSLGDPEALRRSGALVVQQVADVYPGGGPITDPEAQLAAFDGDEGASVLASVPPVRHDATATFSVFADEGAVCLEGEIDAFQVPLLERALAAVPDAPDGEPLVVDLAELRFIDVA